MNDKSSSEKYSSTSFHLAPELIEQLRTAAFERRESQAAIVTEAIRAYLKLPPPAEAKLTKSEAETVSLVLELLRFDAQNPKASRTLSQMAQNLRGALMDLLGVFKGARGLF